MEYGQKGKLEAAQEMVVEATGERFGAVSPALIGQIKSIQSHETLKLLFRQCFRADSLGEFAEQLHRATAE